MAQLQPMQRIDKCHKRKYMSRILDCIQSNQVWDAKRHFVSFFLSARCSQFVSISFSDQGRQSNRSFIEVVNQSNWCKHESLQKRFWGNFKISRYLSSAHWARRSRSLCYPYCTRWTNKYFSFEGLIYPPPPPTKPVKSIKKAFKDEILNEHWNARTKSHWTFDSCNFISCITCRVVISLPKKIKSYRKLYKLHFVLKILFSKNYPISL